MSLPLPGMEPKPLRSCDIRRIVQERLSGFIARQWERDAIRALRRRKLRPPNELQDHFPEAESFQTPAPDPIGLPTTKEKCS